LFRRLSPILLILVCFLLDTTIMPIVYGGVYTVPLTIIAVFGIGMIQGRMSGLLFGTLGGLLMDITTGTLGTMTFFFMFVGFMIGLIVYQPADRLLPSRRKQRRRLMWQATWIFVLYTVGEIAILVAQYFNTATMEWLYLLNILIRALICTALTLLLRPAMQRLLLGRNPGRALPRNREVKNF